MARPNLDEVLAAGMARLRVAPTPTGVGVGADSDAPVGKSRAPTRHKLGKDVTERMNEAATRMLKDETALSDLEIAEEILAMAKVLAAQYKVPLDQVRNFIKRKRREIGGRKLLEPVPALLKRRFSSGKEESKRLRLKSVEGDLAGLLGRPPDREWREADYKYLDDHERELVEIFLDDGRPKDLAALALALGLTAEQTNHVVKSEQARIAKTKKVQRNAQRRISPEVYALVNEYVDLLESKSGAEGMFAAMREHAKVEFGIKESTFKGNAYKELLRRQNARTDRNAPIYLLDSDDVQVRETPNRSRSLSALRLNEEQEAELKWWAENRAIDKTIPWNDRIRELNRLADAMHVPREIVTAYMKANTRFTTGLKGYDSKGLKENRNAEALLAKLVHDRSIDQGDVLDNLKDNEALLDHVLREWANSADLQELIQDLLQSDETLDEGSGGSGGGGGGGSLSRQASIDMQELLHDLLDDGEEDSGGGILPQDSLEALLEETDWFV